MYTPIMKLWNHLVEGKRLSRQEQRARLADKDIDDYVTDKPIRKSWPRFLDATEAIDDSRVYNDYKKAMGGLVKSSGRKGSELDRDSFEDWLAVATIFGGPDLGWVIGHTRQGVFIPSHFAPQGTRKGYFLVKALGDETTPVVVAVTPDLGDQLRKAGWERAPITNFVGNFRGTKVNKEVWSNRAARNKIKEFVRL